VRANIKQKTRMIKTCGGRLNNTDDSSSRNVWTWIENLDFYT